MRKPSLAGCVIIFILLFSGCGENSSENSFDTSAQDETVAVTLTVNEAPDESNFQKELVTLSMDLNSAFYLEDAASATIQGQGEQIAFNTLSDLQYGTGPEAPLIAFLWYSSNSDGGRPHLHVKNIGDGFRYVFEEEVLFNDKLYVFIIKNGYQGSFGDITAVVRIDGVMENRFPIDAELSLVTDDLVDQRYGANPRVVTIDNTYRTQYWVDFAGQLAEPTLIPALIWWPGNDRLLACAFPYDQVSGFYYEGPAVITSSNADLDLADQAKYLFFLIDSVIAGENTQ